MDNFLGTWYGLAIFIAFDVIAAIAVLAIGWRWMFKRLFDLLASVVCMAVLSPVFLGIWIRGSLLRRRTGQPASLLAKEYFVGKKAKAIALNVFRTDGEGTEQYNRSLLKSGLYKLPLLWDIFCGRLSFIGVKKLSLADASLVSEADESRFFVRPGLIHPLAMTGDEESDYADLFRAEKRYVRKLGLFYDLKVFFLWAIRGIRGERNWAGKTAGTDYADALLAGGEITREDYEAVKANALAEEEELKKKYEPAPETPKEGESRADEEGREADSASAAGEEPGSEAEDESDGK